MATTINTHGDDERDYNIICPICQDEFKDPVIIGCHHSFCRTCIDTWIKRSTTRDPQESHEYYNIPHIRRFRCPSCKSINGLPSNGVAGFAKSFYIEQIKDVKAKSLSSYPKCPKHKTEDLRFYCMEMECETTMCRDCKVLKHEGHSAECVADVANDMRAKLRDHIKKTDADIGKLCQTKEACKIDKTKIIEMKQSARNMVKHQVQEMKKTIDNIAGVLDQNICSYFQTYEDDIDKETSVADSKTESLDRFKSVVSREIKTGSDHSVIDHYKGFLKARGQIVVADRKPPNPDYNTKLANVYRKGNINVAELQTMIGTIAEEFQPKQQEIHKAGLAAEKKDATNAGDSKPKQQDHVVAAPRRPKRAPEPKREEIELSTDAATVAVFKKADKC